MASNAHQHRHSWFRRHRRVTLLVLTAIPFLGVLLAFEVALRIWTPTWLNARMTFLAAGGRVEDIGTDRSWKTISENGRFVSFMPGARFDVVHSEYHHAAFIDELGGRKLAARARADTLLPCLGDSFTFGVGVRNGETFIDHLQVGVNEMRLLNLGVPGSALPQQRLIVETRHAELGNPPLYVQFFFLGNDFADIVKSDMTDKEPQRTSTRNDEASTGGAWREWSGRVNVYVSQSWLRKSYAIQFSKRAVMQATKDARKNPVFEMMNSNSAAHHQRARDALHSEIEAWQALSQQHGFRILVVFVPDCYQVIRERRERQAEYYGITPTDLDPLLPNRILVRILAEHGISYVDPTGDFAEMSDVDELYYVNDNHFTASGHLRFAELIRQQVIDAIVEEQR